MGDHVDEARRGTQRARREAKQTVTVELDAVSAAHLRTLADREGTTPEEYAARLVALRLRAICDRVVGGAS
jgi:hypothetical protein